MGDVKFNVGDRVLLARGPTPLGSDAFSDVPSKTLGAQGSINIVDPVDGTASVDFGNGFQWWINYADLDLVTEVEIPVPGAPAGWYTKGKKLVLKAETEIKVGDTVEYTEEYSTLPAGSRFVVTFVEDAANSNNNQVVKGLSDDKPGYQHYVFSRRVKKVALPSVPKEIEEALDNAPWPRALLLREAEKLCCGDRNAQYGSPTQDFKRIAALWSILFDREFAAHEVATAMACVKLSRIKHSPGKRDSWVDGSGYFACGWECVESEEEK